MTRGRPVFHPQYGKGTVYADPIEPTSCWVLFGNDAYPRHVQTKDLRCERATVLYAAWGTRRRPGLRLVASNGERL